MIGQVLGASDLGVPSASCSWRLESGAEWHHTAGVSNGTTQCDSPSTGNAYVWQHPIDATFSGPEMRGWPRIEIEVRGVDAHGRSDLAGYALQPIPTTPGTHRVTCPLWRPKGSKGERFSAWFVGGEPQLKDNALVYGAGPEGDLEQRGGTTQLARAVGDARLATLSSGKVHLLLNVCMRAVPQGDQDRSNAGTAGHAQAARTAGGEGER